MKTLLISLKIFLFFTILTGLVYPLFITAFAQIFFPKNACGSLIIKGNNVIGSELIGQQFDSSIYFFSRPSAITYNPLPSGGSNYGISNTKLKTLVFERKERFLLENKLDSLTIIPSEMLFASGSGLDPHISVKAALLQVNRVCNSRDFDESQKQKVIQSITSLTEFPQFKFLGEERINVLALNLKLNSLDLNLNTKK
jgi:potassium-transporting ATPase KdpC subunit